MSQSVQNYTADGTTRTFAIGMDYLSPADLSVTVNGTDASFTFPSDSTIQLVTVPSAGSAIAITRATDITEPAIDFEDASTLTADNLDTAVRQTLYGLQEMVDSQDYWIDWIQQNASGGTTEDGDSITGLPPITLSNNGSILVAAGGTWTIYSTADAKTLLGLSSTLSVGTAAYCNTGTASGQISLNDSLGTAARINTGVTVGSIPLNTTAAALGTSAYKNTGTSVGQVPVLGDLGSGVAGYPAVRGDAITNVLHSLTTIKATYSTAYNVNGGAYSTGSTGQIIPLNTLQLNESGEASLASGVLTVPWGAYTCWAEATVTNIGFACLRIMQKVSGVWTEMDRGPIVGTASERDVLRLATKFIVGPATEIRLEVLGSAANAVTTALGDASNVSAMGNNVFANLILNRFI